MEPTPFSWWLAASPPRAWFQGAPTFHIGVCVNGAGYLKLGTQPVWPSVAAHRGAYMIHPGAFTQPGRCISALTCGIHHQPSHTPFPAKLGQYSLILTYHFISVQIYSVPSWLPTGPLLQAKTHPSGSFVSVILLTFSKWFAALTIMRIVIVK